MRRSIAWPPPSAPVRPRERQDVRPTRDHPAMAPPQDQLALLSQPWVTVIFHPDRPPPGATGPDDLGAYAAAPEAVPALEGWGRSEDEALTSLAQRLCSHAREQAPQETLTPLGQALTAAAVLPVEDLTAYLRGWAREPVLEGRWAAAYSSAPSS